MRWGWWMWKSGKGMDCVFGGYVGEGGFWVVGLFEMIMIEC